MLNAIKKDLLSLRGTTVKVFGQDSQIDVEAYGYDKDDIIAEIKKHIGEVA